MRRSRSPAQSPGGDAGEEELERLASKLLARARTCQLAAGRGIEAGQVGQVVVFKDRDDKEVGLELAGRSRGERDGRRPVGDVHEVAVSV
jgi:hypothetical protein